MFLLTLGSELQNLVKKAKSILKIYTKRSGKVKCTSSPLLTKSFN